LLSSTDGGANWSEVTITTSFTGTPVASAGFPYASNGGPGDLLYLVTTTGIWVSVDRGANWVSKVGNWTSFSADLYNAVIVPLWTAE
jgi:hypothetical protein